MPPPRPMLPEMGRLVPRTKIEYKETPEAHLFKAELPGVRREDVVVRLDEDGKMLHISAKSKHEKKEKKDKYHCVEKGYGEFVSKFMLPPNSKPELLKSHVDNGVLTVTVPKQKSQHTGHHY
ncbi:17.9 kDa class I heat shock protein [Bienertia sinuspersici]